MNIKKFTASPRLPVLPAFAFRFLEKPVHPSRRIDKKGIGNTIFIRLRNWLQSVVAKQQGDLGKPEFPEYFKDLFIADVAAGFIQTAAQTDHFGGGLHTQLPQHSQGFLFPFVFIGLTGPSGRRAKQDLRETFVLVGIPEKVRVNGGFPGFAQPGIYHRIESHVFSGTHVAAKYVVPIKDMVQFMEDQHLQIGIQYAVPVQEFGIKKEGRRGGARYSGGWDLCGPFVAGYVHQRLQVHCSGGDRFENTLLQTSHGPLRLKGIPGTDLGRKGMLLPLPAHMFPGAAETRIFLIPFRCLGKKMFR
ncbi:MAG: hypothetical protein BWY09_02453 [Candidatus Hydrogenedentes bacterium ADurb.Bin179]|nr:MAG: hypothetical protein BWY09_02453 [Candidatus Hydrogenedentes bacterium ADurb.Bin179]